MASSDFDRAEMRFLEGNLGRRADRRCLTQKPAPRSTTPAANSLRSAGLCRRCAAATGDHREARPETGAPGATVRAGKAGRAELADGEEAEAVIARTLNVCCHDHLGMGPKHYLLLRRLHMVRRALRESTPAETTVTEVATQYGFWQFGRLAVEYKALFGEAPSATLARPQ
jgi:AraC-like DNA-binding protein